MLTSVQTDEIVRALADPLRRQIIELLVREQLCTCHLVEETGARQTNVSNHLRILRDAGLVDAEPHGRYTYYRAVPDALAQVANAFTRLASDAAISGPKRPCP